MAQVQEIERQEQRLRMSYEEFLERFDEDVHAEWVNGEAIIFMPADQRHQELITFLIFLFDAFVSLYELGKVFTAPFEMRVTPQGNAREPDLMFVANAHLPWLVGRRLAGPADLIVEVISPESATRDRREKFQEYQEAGVREYWLIDPRAGRQRADFWVLDEQGTYQAVPIDADGIYRSTVVENFWIDVKWLQRSELPNHWAVFARIVNPRDFAEVAQRLSEQEGDL
jgi:Uma2 family endonuclease